MKPNRIHNYMLKFFHSLSLLLQGDLPVSIQKTIQSFYLNRSLYSYASS